MSLIQKAPYSQIPAVLPAMALVAGIALHSATSGSVLIPIGAALVAALLLIVRRGYLSMIFVFLALGYASAAMHTPTLPPAEDMGKKYITAEVQEINQGSQTTTMVAKVLALAASDSSASATFKPFRCQIFTNSTDCAIAPHDTIAFFGTISLSEPEPTLPYCTDFHSIRLRNNITTTATCYSGHFHIVGQAGGWHGFINSMRNYLLDAIIDAGFSQDTTSFMLAVLLGDDNYLPADAVEDFRASGLAHILAISGLHVGLVLWIIIILLYPLRATSFSRSRFLIAIPLVWMYALIVGLPASAVRAATMVTVYLLCRLFQRQTFAMNSLAVAVILMLLIRPSDLFTPGFQMSVLAVLCVIALTPWVSRPFLKKPISLFVARAIAIPIIAMIGTAVVAIVWFNRFPAGFLPGNIVAGALLPILMLSGISAVILSYCGISCGWLAATTNTLFSWICDVAESMAAIQPRALNAIHLSTPALVCYIIMLFFLLWWAYIGNRKLAYPTAIAAVVFVIFLAIPPRHADDYEAYVLSSRSTTDIILRHNNHVVLTTTADSTDHRYKSRSLTNLLRGYLAFSGCTDSLRIVAEYSPSPDMSLNGKLLTLGSKKALIVDSAISPEQSIQPLTYALISKGFKDDIVATARRLQADTVVFCSNLNARRTRRYERECSIAAIPTLNLRNHGPLHIAPPGR